MSASKIKEAMMKHFECYDAAEHAALMAQEFKGKKKQECLDEEEWNLEGARIYAEEIKELNPSKYMLNKYPELQDILETI